MDIPTVETLDNFNWQVPECCREGHPDCPHAIRSEKKRIRGNIGL